MIALLLLVAAGSIAASWTQAGYDPARTGEIPFQGPATNDTALEVQFPGTVRGTPVLEDDTAYVVTEANEHWREDLSEDALWRLNVSTGEKERVMDLPLSGHGFLTPDQQLLLQATDREIVALEVPEGSEAWRAAAFEGLLEESDLRRQYGQPVFEDGLAYVPIIAYEAASNPENEDQWLPTRWFFGAVAVDLQSGDVTQQWVRQMAPPEQADEQPVVDVPSVPVQGQEERLPGGNPTLTVGQDRVFVYLQTYASSSNNPIDVGGYASSVRYELWGLDKASLTTQWHETDTTNNRVSLDQVGYLPGAEWTQVWCCGAAVSDPARVYIRLDDPMAMNPATGEENWRTPSGESDEFEARGALGMGLREGTVIGTSTQTVYRFDAATGEVYWERVRRDSEPGAEGHGVGTVVTDEERTYVQTMLFSGEHPAAGYGIDARDLQTGDLEWTWRNIPEAGVSGGRSGGPAFGDGFFAWGGWDGVLHVIGETAASPTPTVEASTEYPKAGEPVTVDLSGSQAGAQGPVTEYRVDWGDGTVTDWQQDPALSHVYEEEGDVEATVQVGNEANQTASKVLTFHVGEEKPAEPTWLSERFEQDNQDMTFGVIGIALALGGGVITAGRRYRKRSNLEDELKGLEEGFKETKDHPTECEAFLDNRKARARSLAIDGRLKEDQVGIIENRAEELRGKLRSGMLDERFQFLPHGMVQSLKRMLSDGRINGWERDTLEDLLDRDETLNEAQKERVRGLLERWSTDEEASP